MMGEGQGNYRPESSITRGEFAVMLWRSLGEPAPADQCPFTDVPADAYYRAAVTALYEMDVVTGIGDNLFAPGTTLTCEMGIVMLARAYKLALQDSSIYASFTDAGQVSSLQV